MTVEELLECPYWVIDLLPRQVPEGSPGQYFAIERYYLSEPQLSAVKQKHIDLVLKLNCYRDLYIDELGVCNPAPERLAAAMRRQRLCILAGGALLVSEPDDLTLTLYHPDAALLSLVRALAAGEGLYVWQPPQEQGSENL